jgi:hypothetical protein
MVHEWYYGDYEKHDGWKCIFCGELIDPIILKNRFTQSQHFGSLLTVPRASVVSQK